MSGFRLKLRSAPSERIDLSALLPAAVAPLSDYNLGKLSLSGESEKVSLGDIFTISGTSGETLTIESGSDRLDFIGADLAGGTLVIEGDVGAYCGAGMKGGRIDVRGNAGAFLASGMKHGVITVKGNAGDFTGALRAGEKFGMTGGTVHVGGTTGTRTGDRMRRGTIVVRGQTGSATGARMVGGTIITEKGFGDGPGPLLRRGTLIGPSAARLLPTFADCGKHNLLILRLIEKHLASKLGTLAPALAQGAVRKFAGDLSTIGKGELLLTA